MEVNSCLNALSVRQTCEDYMKYLRNENDAYWEILSKVKSFLDEDDSKGEAIEGIKTQMEDYSTVLTALRLANYEDIIDATSFITLVGNEVIDGRLVRHEQKNAHDDESYYKTKASDAWQKAYFATSVTEAEQYSQEARGYEGLENDARERYLYFKGREELYDSIDSSSSSYFQNSYVYRNNAYQLLSLMHDSYLNGKYFLSDERIKLREECVNGVTKGYEKIYGEWNSDNLRDEFSHLNDLSEAEYNAFVTYLRRQGIQIEEGCTRDELKTAVFTSIQKRMEADAYAPYGGQVDYTVAPYEKLNSEQRKIYVALYEAENPEDASRMNNLEKQFKENAYDGYEEDLVGVKFLTYTAPEPYKTIYLEYFPEIKIARFDYTGNEHFDCEKGIFINHSKMHEGTAEGFNTFFHECAHNIDYLMGIKLGNKDNQYYTELYVGEASDQLLDVLKSDVDKRIDEKIEQYEIENNLPKGTVSREEVKDAIFNMVDCITFGYPEFKTKRTEDAYYYVVKNIRGELRGTSYDIYGAFSGNTFCFYANGGGGIEDIKKLGRIHDALLRENYREGPGGQLQDECTAYWAKNVKINKDGTGLTFDTSDKNDITEDTRVCADNKSTLYESSSFAQKVIDSEDNIQHSSSISREFFAETMASNMTQQKDEEASARNYYSKDTTDFFEKMLMEAP